MAQLLQPHRLETVAVLAIHILASVLVARQRVDQLRAVNRTDAPFIAMMLTHAILAS
jgi:hypothetical protein